MENDVLRQFGKGKKTELKKGGRAVIYQRVSSKEQEFGFSPEVQMDVCRKWADSHGYKVEKTFEGEHESAKSDVNRKRFNSMLKFVEDRKNKIDAVIVYSTSRFSRTGAKGALTIVEELQQRGITVLAHVQNPVLRIERKYVPLCVEPKVCEYVIRTLQGSAAHGPTRCAIGLL